MLTQIVCAYLDSSLSASIATASGPSMLDMVRTMYLSSFRFGRRLAGNHVVVVLVNLGILIQTLGGHGVHLMYSQFVSSRLHDRLFLWVVGAVRRHVTVMPLHGWQVVCVGWLVVHLSHGRYEDGRDKLYDIRLVQRAPQAQRMSRGRDGKEGEPVMASCRFCKRPERKNDAGRK